MDQIEGHPGEAMAGTAVYSGKKWVRLPLRDKTRMLGYSSKAGKCARRGDAVRCGAVLGNKNTKLALQSALVLDDAFGSVLNGRVCRRRVQERVRWSVTGRKRGREHSSQALTTLWWWVFFVEV